MIRALEAVSAVLYPLVIVAMLAGFGWTGLQWLMSHGDSPVPVPVAGVCAVTTLLLSGWLCERLLPLTALSQQRWIYHERPRRRLRGLDEVSLVQVAAFLLAGLFLGVATGWLVQFTLLGPAARLLPALRRRYRLPDLLRAGRTRLVGSSPWAVQDSEMVADALAATWLRRVGTGVSTSRAALFLRRLRRRSYLLIIAAILLLGGVALAPLGPCPFILGWGVLGAGLYRCADVSRLRPDQLWMPVLAGHGLLAALVVWGIWGANPAATAAAVVFIAYRRGQPRRVITYATVDSGFGISTSPGLSDYYLRGLVVGTLLAALTYL